MNSDISYLRQEGTALVLVLWMLSLMSIIAVSYTLTVRNEIMLVNNMVRGSEARALAEAGIWTIIDVMANESAGQFYADGEPLEMILGGSVIRISVEDESGRIDLNTSDEALLTGMVESSAVPKRIQGMIVDQILDWRDRDSEPRKEGAEDNVYTATGIKRGPKNDAFNTVEELKEIPSITPEIFNSLEPLLTVHSQEKGINYTTASRQVLLAVPGISESQADWINRNRYSEAAHIFNFIPAESHRYMLRKSSTVYRITSRAQSGNVVSRIRAIVKLDGRERSFSVLDWREG